MKVITAVFMGAALSAVTALSFSEDIELYSPDVMTAPIGSSYMPSGPFSNSTVTYSIVDGEMIYEGDIVLGKYSETNKISSRSIDPRSIAIIGSNVLWEDSEIPYTIDGSLSTAMQARVNSAINHWESNTNVDLILRTTDNQAQFRDFVTFTVGEGCSSSVGKVGGQQFIRLINNCSTGNIIHEIGHASGLWHEQSRADRDLFIELITDNIEPDRLSNFNQHIKDGVDLGDYDYGSIMHYSLINSFGIDTTKPTMSAIGTVPSGVTIGQRLALSPGDLNSVNWLYGDIDLNPTVYDTSLGWQEGGIPTKVLRGDFNNDGIMDILQARGESDTSPSRYLFFTYLSNGDGTFESHNFDTNLGWQEGGVPTEIMTGDFNGDGLDDILLARGEADTSPVRYLYFTYLSNGDGTYTRKSYDTQIGWQEGGIPTKLFVGDFNNDGMDDVLQARGESDSGVARYLLITYLSTGNGSYSKTVFDTSLGWQEGGVPTELFIGDFDGDGSDDVLQARGEADTSPVRYIFFTHFSNGNGLYTTESHDTKLGWEEGGIETKLLVSDFNGDGKSDILQARGESDTTPTRYILFVNSSNGDGTFTRTSHDTKRDLSIGNLPTHISVGDLDGDGRDDITLARSRSAEQSHIYNLYTYFTDAAGKVTERVFDTNISAQEGGIPTQFMIDSFGTSGENRIVLVRGEADTSPHRLLFVTYTLPF